ncbi:hypothetical protein Emag_004713 [Eimeria magna]
MAISKADSNDGEQAKSIVLSAYEAAASSCGAPPLAPFVSYNNGHLPSSFPSEFLAVHAAFCIKDGEAPQVPDYLVAGSDATTSKVSSVNEQLTSIQPLDVKPAASEATIASNGFEADKGLGLGRRSFQFKALRRALEFQLPGGTDFKSFKSPLIDYVMQSASADSSSGLAAGSLSSKDTQATGKVAAHTLEHGPADSSLNPLLSDTRDFRGVAPTVEGKNMLHQYNYEAGKRSGSDLVENPLLRGIEERSTEHSIGSSEATPNDKLCGSEEVSVKKRRGLNTAAMRQKNVAQVMSESQGNTRPDDLEGDCVFVSRYGICPYGCCCRFGRSHVNASGSNYLSDGEPVTAADLQKYHELRRSEELNTIGDQCKTYFANRHRRRPKTSESPGVPVQAADQVGAMGEVGGGVASEAASPSERATEASAPNSDVESAKRVGSIDKDKDDVGLEERRRRFAALVKGKTFLAPLTTLGNLPFRRLCTRLGADVTVSEMAVAKSLVEGKASELSLLKRHCTEKIFGVQVAAGFPDVARDCGKLLSDLNISCDFVDLNIACPLDQLHRRFKGQVATSQSLAPPFTALSTWHSLTLWLPTAHHVLSYFFFLPGNAAAGSCMLEKPAVVESVVKSLIEACPSIPITLKVRTAHYGKQHQLHVHMERELMPEDVMLIGCGDILSSAEFHYRKLSAGMDALMIGRGALIKPWIFTEIKEQRLWDITATERLSLVKEFVDNGLEHWGSDRRGVANTRRFLLELLSFMHRYIPPPFLELQPQLIQWRPSPFKGRSDLEIKLSSPKPSVSTSARPPCDDTC